MKAITALGVATILLAGCGTSVSDSPDPTPVPPAAAESSTASASAASSTPPTDQPKKNERGNVVKKVGEKAMLLNASNEKVLTFVVTKITPKFKCTDQYAQPAENGNFIAVMIEATTSPKYERGSVYFGPGGMKVIGPDGTTENSSSSGSSYGCVKQSQQFPQDLGPGETAKGLVILDSKHTKGGIVISGMHGDGGWEWAF